MLDAALMLVIDSATSVTGTSLGTFWVLAHVNVFTVSADVSKGGEKTGRTQHHRRVAARA